MPNLKAVPQGAESQRSTCCLLVWGTHMATTLMSITVLWMSGLLDAIQSFMKLINPPDTGIEEEEDSKYMLLSYTHKTNRP